MHTHDLAKEPRDCMETQHHHINCDTQTTFRLVFTSFFPPFIPQPRDQLSQTQNNDECFIKHPTGGANYMSFHTWYHVITSVSMDTCSNPHTPLFPRTVSGIQGMSVKPYYPGYCDYHGYTWDFYPQYVLTYRMMTSWGRYHFRWTRINLLMAVN